jgi:NAD-dependent DNA ligase
MDLQILISDAKKDIKSLSIKDIVEILTIASNLYYNTGELLISDKLFDSIKDELESRDPKHPFLKEVGAPPRNPDFKKVKHPYFLASLNKIKPENIDKLQLWLSKYNGPYVLSDKLDGNSALLTIDNAVATIATRGKGTDGDDISHILPFIRVGKGNKTVSEIITENYKVFDGSKYYIRGEILYTKNYIIKNNLTKARSIANGVIQRKTLDKDTIKELKNLNFVSYEQIFPKIDFLSGFNNLDNLGFKTPFNKIINYNKDLTMDLLEDFLKDRRNRSDYEIDGIVVFDNSKQHPRPKDNNPKYAFAFKIDDEEGETTSVIEVEWNITRYANLAPRIKIEQINLSGSEVNYTTGINAKWIHDNQIGPGTIVKVILGGEIIPKIIEVIKSTGAQMPTIPYFWRDSDIEIYVNPRDKDVGLWNEYLEKVLTHFFKSIDAKGISEGIVAQLVDNGYDDIGRILNASVCDLSFLGPKLADNVYNSMHESLNGIGLIELMVASNQFGMGLGKRKFKMILDMYPKIVYDFKDTTNIKVNIDKLTDIILTVPGFQIKTASLFANNYYDFIRYVKKYPQFHRFLIPPNQQSNQQLNQQLKGDQIVFSGFRDVELEKKIEIYGGKISNNVSKNTTILLVKDMNQETNKTKKAKQLGIKIMTVNDFLTFLHI